MLQNLLMKKHLLTAVIVAITSALCHAQTVELWGLTSGGGQDTSGVIFKVTSTGTLTAQYSFKDYYSSDSDGFSPIGSLLQANDGLLYGLTSRSSISNYGAIFRFDATADTEKALSFFNSYNGAEPNGSFIQATNGLLYATTSSEGAYDAGSVISYNITTGVTTDIYDFNDNNDGNSPEGALLQANDGLLYGLTSSGGTNGAGEIFSIDPTNNNNYTVLYNFVYNDTDGVRPMGALMQATNGLLYGLAFTGGSYSGYGGTIFSYNITTNKETTLWSFGSNTDGSTPCGSLIQVKGIDSVLFGLTNGGDSNTDGTIFSYNINTGIEHTRHIFNLNGSEGLFPYGSLMQASDGKLYGTTSYGGTNDYGTIFSFDYSTNAVTVVASFDGANGAMPYGDLTELTPTSINQVSVNSNEVSVYPNPSTGLVTINSTKNISTITVTNLLGQIILAQPAPLSSGVRQIDLSNYPAGMYFVTVKSGDETETSKIVLDKKQNP